MIGDALRLEIERYAARMPLDNPLYTRAAAGTLQAEHLVAYLKSVHLLVQHTPIHLHRAEARANALADRPLARHYRAKRGEEQGHDAWAERDLGRVSAQVVRPIATAAHPAMLAMIAFIERVIDEDPALYLSYILFAEYLIVLLGPQWLELLESRCGIPRASMTVIGNHAELDREHVSEAFEVIDALVGDPRKLPAMRRVLRESIAGFETFCRGVIEDADVDLHLSASAPAA